jgi:hypothetical protein
MKKLLSLLVVMLMIISVFAVPAFGVDGGEFSTPLYAGQDQPVGDVFVTNDGTNIYVKYLLNDDAKDEGWVLRELHLAVESEIEVIPNKGGNPAPGQFEYKIYFDYDDTTTEYKFAIPISDIGTEIRSVCLAAHAVVEKVTIDDSSVILYATENNHPVLNQTLMDANIYSINILGDTNIVTSTPTAIKSSTDNFNGNAYDDISGRFYFSDYAKLGVSPSHLYFNYLNGLQQDAGMLGGAASGGTIYEGDYYYITERTDDLRKVEFDTDGTISSDTIIKHIFNNNGTVLAFGDIDIRVESGKKVIYGCGTKIPEYDPVFFKMNIDGTGYTQIKTGELYGAGGAQISFGSDGILYGVNARSPYELFTINTVTGVTTFIKNLDKSFSDLASGPDLKFIIIDEETAWGYGTRFVESGSWGMYFTYNLMEETDFIETVTVNPNGVTVQSNNVLEEGANYLLKASGAFTYNSANAWADAEYYLLNGKVVKGDTEGSRDYVLDVSINGLPVNDNWGEYNSEHTYSMEYTGTGQKLDFFIYDSVYSDNAGFITVKILKVNY